MPNFFSGLANLLLLPFQDASSAAAAALSSAVIPAVLAALSCNIAWQGMNLARGVGGQHLLLDLFAQNFRAILVLLLALGVGSGYSTLVAAAGELQTSLITYTAPGASTQSAPAVLDGQLKQLVASYKTLMKVGFDHITMSPLGGSDFSGFEVLVVGSIVALALLLFMSFAFVEVIAIQAAIFMIAAIGPLFVAAAAFRATSSYFSGWLNGLLRYSIEIAFLLVLVGIGIKTTGQINAHLAGDLNGGVLSTDLDLGFLVLEAVGTAVILTYLTLKVDAIAASVFGGASVSGAAVALAAATGAAVAGLARQSGVPGFGGSLHVRGHAGGANGGNSSPNPEVPGTGDIAGVPRYGIDTLGSDWASSKSRR